METIDLKSLRKSTGLNQQQFWAAVNVTQSGGSRYESGRKMPKSVASLVDLVYVKRINVDDMPSADDVKMLHAIRSNHPDLYHNLQMIVAAGLNG